MKIKMEIDENLQDEEIIVRCRELSDDVVAMQRRIAEAVHAGMRLSVETWNIIFHSMKFYFLRQQMLLWRFTRPRRFMKHICGYMNWKKCFRAAFCGCQNPAL